MEMPNFIDPEAPFAQNAAVVAARMVLRSSVQKVVKNPDLHPDELDSVSSDPDRDDVVRRSLSMFDAETKPENSFAEHLMRDLLTAMCAIDSSKPSVRMWAVEDELGYAYLYAHEGKIRNALKAMQAAVELEEDLDSGSGYTKNLKTSYIIVH